MNVCSGKYMTDLHTIVSFEHRNLSVSCVCSLPQPSEVLNTETDPHDASVDGEKEKGSNQ